MKTFVDLIRHGETQSNKENRFRGDLDLQLNEKGLAQAQKLAQGLRNMNYAALYSSPLERAVKTLEPLAQLLHLDVVTDQRINNLALPLWQGKTYDQVQQQWPEQFQLWQRSPELLDLGGNEKLTDVGNRSFQCLCDLVARHQGTHFVLCSHQSVLKPLIAKILNIPIPWFWKITINEASVTRLSYSREQGWSLIFSNHTFDRSLI